MFMRVLHVQAINHHKILFYKRTLSKREGLLIFMTMNKLLKSCILVAMSGSG